MFHREFTKAKLYSRLERDNSVCILEGQNCKPDKLHQEIKLCKYLFPSAIWTGEIKNGDKVYRRGKTPDHKAIDIEIR